jgi:hypothetical protein
VSLFSPPLHGATLPAVRLCCGGGEGAPRRLTVVAASSSSGPLYPTPPPTEQTIERAKLEQVLCLSLLIDICYCFWSAREVGLYPGFLEEDCVPKSTWILGFGN